MLLLTKTRAEKKKRAKADSNLRLRVVKIRDNCKDFKSQQYAKAAQAVCAAWLRIGNKNLRF